MLSVQDAETTILNLVQLLQEIETVDLLSAESRILANPVISNLDFPHWDNSAMDGYAVKYADVKLASAENPIKLEIVEEIPAGYQPKITIKSGQAARIFTGAIIPEGADTVVMQEKTTKAENQVLILAAPEYQEFVRHQGSFYQAGNQLLPAGIKLNAAEIAVLAAAQCHQFNVFRRPRVAIFSTGDELRKPEEILHPGQIVDSNQYALSALIKQAGAEPLRLGIVKDHPDALREIISTAINQADIVLSSGGVSVGEYDYVEDILTSLGAKIHFQSVRMRPGKPLTFATFANQNQTLYFGLPGNPVAALVTFWRFVQPAIDKLSGMKEGGKIEFLKTKTLYPLKSNGKLETYIWGNLHLIDGVYHFQPVAGNLSSGNLINLAQTNALAVVPVGINLISPHEDVLVLKVR